MTKQCYTCLKTVGPELRGCGLVFGSWEELQEHEKTHVPPSSKTVSNEQIDNLLDALDCYESDTVERDYGVVRRWLEMISAVGPSVYKVPAIADYCATHHRYPCDECATENRGGSR